MRVVQGGMGLQGGMGFQPGTRNQGDREGRPYNIRNCLSTPYIVGATLAVALVGEEIR